jgi:putative transposase
MPGSAGSTLHEFEAHTTTPQGVAAAKNESYPQKSRTQGAIMGTRHSEEQIIAIPKQGKTGPKTVELCRQPGITEQTYYRWKAKYSEMDSGEAKRLKQLEDKNRKRKQVLAEALRRLDYPGASRRLLDATRDRPLDWRGQQAQLLTGRGVTPPSRSSVARDGRRSNGSVRWLPQDAACTP